jgi:hypothetical protein
VAREPVPARDPLSLRRGEKQRHVVSTLSVARREHLAGNGAAEHPLEGVVSCSPEVGGYPDPVEVHVHRQRGRMRVIAQPTLLAHAFREGKAASPQFARHRDGQIAGPPQIVEVLLEEAILPVVAGRALAETPEHGLGQDRGRGRWGHDRGLLSGDCTKQFGRSRKW